MEQNEKARYKKWFPFTTYDLDELNKIHTAELKIVDSVCHDMMLDPDWRNIADLIFKFIEKTIDKKSGDNYNDNCVSTQAHQGGE